MLHGTGRGEIQPWTAPAAGSVPSRHRAGDVLFEGAGADYQRRSFHRQRPCRCGSEKLADVCCLRGKFWFKAPASLNLREPSTGKSVDRCYMKELMACDGPISGEHLISRSVIDVLAGDSGFSIAGTPWLPAGESKIVGPNSLTANCLCKTHNTKLHPLDDAARFFFRILKDCLENEDHASVYLLSGHDIERWLLKTVKVMAESQNLSQRGERLAGAFATDIRTLEMLERIESWPEGTGLYCTMRTGDLATNDNRFQIAPLTNQNTE